MAARDIGPEENQRKNGMEKGPTRILNGVDRSVSSDMKESEWLRSSKLEAMLEFVRDNADDRKLRLFGVACCRRVWNLLDADCRDAVDIAEKYADGLERKSTL